MKYFDNLDPDYNLFNSNWPHFHHVERHLTRFLGHQQIACFQRSLADFPANLGSAQQNIDGAVKLIDHECVSNIDESKTEELAKESFLSKFHPKNFIPKFRKFHHV